MPGPRIVPPFQKKSSVVKVWVAATSSEPPLLIAKCAVEAMSWVLSTLPVPRIVDRAGRAVRHAAADGESAVEEVDAGAVADGAAPSIEPPLLTMIVPPALFEVMEPSLVRTVSRRVPLAPQVLEMDRRSGC